MISKQCSRCKRLFPATTEFFYKHKSHHKQNVWGLFSQCIECKKSINHLNHPPLSPEQRKERHEKAVEGAREYKKKYNQTECVKKQRHEYYLAHSNPKRRAGAHGGGRDKAHRREYNRLYMRRKRTEDIQFKIATILRSRISNIIGYGLKSGSAVRDLGCSVEELKKHLESQFADGMSWENWGKDGWHIDHISPLSRADLTRREEFLRVAHYSNLRPLWAIDNFRKGNRI